MAPKRKRSDIAAAATVAAMEDAAETVLNDGKIPPAKREAAGRKKGKVITNPNKNAEIMDAPDALRASPDSDINEDLVPGPVKRDEGEESPLSDVPEVEPPKKRAKGGRKKAADTTETNGDSATAPKTPPASAAKATPKAKASADDDALRDPEAEEGDEEANEDEVREALSRPPPVNSSYLPLPWKGRLGYACLNTYLRYSNPPVFSSRTCRIASILEHRHPLQDPSQPEHATKNRPDRSKPADESLGKRYVEEICLANVRDIAKMIRWNDKYGIKFLRLSSEMFPFASHQEYGYKLAPFASDALAEAGKVIARLGHRVTTHPGQFTQLGSPRPPVIENALRDLEYHDEMLSLLKLPEQQNKDAVMIIHMGGVFGDKAATLDRFRETYAKLSQSVKNRIVLENDDVCYSVHDILPVCEEMNIPMVLDFHHHNILFDSEQIREGTKDIMDLYPRILATWQKKGITPKMHYSEPTPAAITPRQRRKHNPRVMSLPPCPDTMDLMIEAKDKEQAVFELMRTFKLPGWETFNDIIPYNRSDDNKLAIQELQKAERKHATAKAKRAKKGVDPSDDEEAAPVAKDLVPDTEVGMGGLQSRVYWPPGMEDYLRPKKREMKKKDDATPKRPLSVAEKKAKKAAEEAEDARIKAEERADGEEGEDAEAGEAREDSDLDATPATKKAKAAMRRKAAAAAAKSKPSSASASASAVEGGKTGKSAAVKTEDREDEESTAPVAARRAAKKKTPTKKRAGRAKKEEEEVEAAPTPTSNDVDDDDEGSVKLEDLGSESDGSGVAAPPETGVKRQASRKSARGKGRVSYAVDGEDEDGDVDMGEA